MGKCESCNQPITARTGRVNPGWGFGNYHPDCWRVKLTEIKRDHLVSDTIEGEVM